MEGVGPVTVEQVREFLAHTHVTVRPVLDLEVDHPVDGYEVPDRLREQVRLRTPAEVFPWSGNLSRRKDLDHTVPYLSPDRGGPPGQTRIGNLGPLSRYGHRVKTHGRGWRHHQPVPGVFLWRTPHGYWFRTDHTGTHRLGKNPTRGGPRRPHEHALSRRGASCLPDRSAHRPVGFGPCPPRRKSPTCTPSSRPTTSAGWCPSRSTRTLPVPWVRPSSPSPERTGREPSSGTTCAPRRPGWPAPSPRGRPRPARTSRSSASPPPTSSTTPPAAWGSPARCSPRATTPRSTTGSRCAAPTPSPSGWTPGSPSCATGWRRATCRTRTGPAASRRRTCSRTTRVT